MDGRLSKALMGLGGTGAAAGGGLFLNNLLSGRKESKDSSALQIIKEEEERAKVLETYSKSVNDTGLERYIVRSHYLQEFGESNGILKVEGSLGYEASFSYDKQEMADKEKEYWEKIMKKEDEAKIEIDEKILKEIDGESVEYWEKYKKACVKWNLQRTEDQFKDNYMCSSSETEAEYLKRPEYEKYLKAKEENNSLSFREFYGTEWMKFSKKCNQAMKNQNITSEKISNFYDAGKTNPNTCQSR